jgi:hypothetical protein
MVDLNLLDLGLVDLGLVDLGLPVLGLLDLGLVDLGLLDLGRVDFGRVDPNLAAAWIGILLGMAGGAILGLSFHGEGWLGGYGSWRRRLLRLGHVSLFGLAFLNLAFAHTADRMGWNPGTDTAPYGTGVASALFVAGAVLMPLVCGLAAWRVSFRHLFLLPVGSLLAGTSLTIAALVRNGGGS